MWRSFFLAMGVYLLLLGCECLVIDKAILASTTTVAPPPTPSYSELGYSYYDTYPVTSNEPVNRVVEPPDWAPWSLLSVGAVMVLYAFIIRRAN